ncbi:MAG: orotate phosphoribosyltransferase [Casimicrobiaceae bacterium]
MDTAVPDFRQAFLDFSLKQGVLKFGSFTTKSGRNTPYFFNSGLFNNGEALRRLGEYYAQAYLESGVPCDVLFGPAYKGIPLVAATAIALAAKGYNLPWAHDRKEIKDHGEGGKLVGSPLTGRVLIIDDVITDGGAKREAIELIRAQGAQPAAVLIALDRQERGRGDQSPVQEIERDYGIPVIAIATLADLFTYMRARASLAEHLPRIEAYREAYGVK